MKTLKIGITIDTTHINSLWVNGIQLNILFLYELLKKTHYVCLLIAEKDGVPTKPEHLKNVDLFWVEEKMQDLDLIFIMGTELRHEVLTKFKQTPNKKVIAYRCGNSYLVTAEQILFKPNLDNQRFYENLFDEVWFVPQQQECNQGYFEVLHRTKALAVPFLWHHKFISKSAAIVEVEHRKNKSKKGYAYNKHKNKKVLGILEPNINLQKYCLLPAMIAEECYRKPELKEKIEKLMIGNSAKLKNHKTFLTILKTFDLYNDGKISSEQRYETTFIVTQHMDVVISHQIINALNYLYLDVAFLGYPILHNAWMCKDVGYYYEASNVQEGASKLEWILNEHDKNIESYVERNNIALNRYNIDNPKLLECYNELIHNVFNGIDNKKYIYNPATNLLS